MATRHEDEGGSRLWRGMRALIFGEDREPTLRDQIEDAIEEHPWGIISDQPLRVKEILGR